MKIKSFSTKGVSFCMLSWLLPNVAVPDRFDFTWRPLGQISRDISHWRNTDQYTWQDVQRTRQDRDVLGIWIFVLWCFYAWVLRSKGVLKQEHTIRGAPPGRDIASFHADFHALPDTTPCIKSDVTWFWTKRTRLPLKTRIVPIRIVHTLTMQVVSLPGPWNTIGCIGRESPHITLTSDHVILNQNNLLA
jgi:hypothetical protein